MRQRSQLPTHVINSISHYNLPPFSAKLSYKGSRDIEEVVKRFPHECARMSIRADPTTMRTATVAAGFDEFKHQEFRRRYLAALLRFGAT